MDVVAPKPKCKTNSPFKVSAKTAADADKVLKARGCWGRHDWNTTWKWEDADNVVTKVTLTPTSAVTLLDWPGAKKLPAAKKKEWDKAIKALKKHEQNHHDKFVKWYEALPAALKKLGDVPGKDVDKHLNKALADHRAEQKAYDKSSKNGGNEGVKFTP